MCVNGMMALSIVISETFVVMVLLTAVAYLKPDLFFLLAIFGAALSLLMKKDLDKKLLKKK